MKKTVLIALLILGAGKLKAQLVSIKETSYNSTDTLKLNKQPIVDINSKLSIEIKKARLLTTIPQNDKSNQAMAAKLKTLLFILQSQDAILKALTPAVPGKVDAVALKAVSDLMNQFYQRVTANPDIRVAVDTLLKRATDLSRAGKLQPLYPTRQAYMIKNLALVTDTLVAGIQNSPEMASITIQLAAFLNTKAENGRKVHVENFDNYSAGEYYEVPRWVTSFSQADLDQFDQVSKMSATLNALVSSKFSDISKLIPDTLKTFACFNTMLDSIQVQASATATQSSTSILSFTANVQKDAKDLVAAMKDVSKFKNTTDVNALQQFNQTSGRFVTLANNLKNDFKTLQSQLTAAVLNADAKLKALNTQLKGCMADLDADISTVTYIYNIASNLLKPFQATANTAQQVTGNVFDLSISKLPALGYVDLKTTGKRENGDELVVKLIYRTKDDVDKNLPGTTLESETIQLQQVNFYSETNIGVILAKPFHNSSDVTLGNKFQFAPAGSLLLKFGSREHKWWNDLSPGFGFNISTPDFNLDGSPDISYGGVITLFRNVLSTGLSYNTKSGSPFWFFGLSLPFSTIGLPLGNVQTQKTQ